MSDLVITRAVPNPAGKDRTPSNRVTNEQLNGEWMEFKNITAGGLDIAGVSLSHNTFDSACRATGERQLMTFHGVLNSGQSLRIHTGVGQLWDEGAVRHLYLGEGNFVWNNRCGDTATLRVKGALLDHASYDRDPPEGVVLVRAPGTNRLVVSVPAYTR